MYVSEGGAAAERSYELRLVGRSFYSLVSAAPVRRVTTERLLSACLVVLVRKGQNHTRLDVMTVPERVASVLPDDHAPRHQIFEVVSHNMGRSIRRRAPSETDGTIPDFGYGQPGVRLQHRNDVLG